MLICSSNSLFCTKTPRLRLRYRLYSWRQSRREYLSAQMAKAELKDGPRSKHYCVYIRGFRENAQPARVRPLKIYSRPTAHRLICFHSLHCRNNVFQFAVGLCVLPNLLVYFKRESTRAIRKCNCTARVHRDIIQRQSCYRNTRAISGSSWLGYDCINDSAEKEARSAFSEPAFLKPFCIVTAPASICSWLNLFS